METDRKIKLLIADDEVEYATTVVSRLKLRGFDTVMANSGKETIESIQTHLPDVLILDLKMPDCDGLEVLEQIQEYLEKLKVIIVTGHGSFEAGHIGMELGAFDYIMKPVDLNLMIKKIHDACGVDETL